MARDTALSSLAMVGSDRGTVLIHWDLPTDSKTTFTLRFTFIRSEVRSIFSSAPAQQVRVVLMLGSEDATSLSTIIPFLKRSGASIPDGLFYNAVSLTEANQVLVTGSPLNMTTIQAPAQTRWREVPYQTLPACRAGLS